MPSFRNAFFILFFVLLFYLFLSNNDDDTKSSVSMGSSVLVNQVSKKKSLVL